MHLNLNGADPQRVELELLYEYSPDNAVELAILIEWYKVEDGKDMGSVHQLEQVTRHRRLRTYIKNWSK